MSESWQLQLMRLLEILPGNSKLDDNFHFSIQVEINRNLYPLYLSVSGSMSEAPRHWSWATPPAHGAVDGGVTAGKG